MLIPGLVSVTFRSLGPQDVIRLVKQTGLRAIEWGGDIHVPQGDTARAREVGQRTIEAGLMISGYGSYYRLGDDGSNFEPVLASAVALGAPTIRVWAGTKGSVDCSLADRARIIADALRVAELASRWSITISLEYHGDTLTDTRESVQALLIELAHPNIQFLWQPPNGESFDASACRLLEVLPRMRNVHVFHWWPTAAERHPLIKGADRWMAYIDIIRTTGRDVDFLLEFTAGNSADQFLADAAVLRRLLDQEPMLPST
jgi:3-dehydroshikimate dehydratase